MNCIIKQQSELNAEEWNSFVYSNSMGWAYYLYDMITLKIMLVLLLKQY